jgi:hypothetical protein
LTNRVLIMFVPYYLINNWIESQNKHLHCLYLLRAQVFIHAFTFAIMVTAIAYHRSPYQGIVLMVIGDILQLVCFWLVVLMLIHLHWNRVLIVFVLDYLKNNWIKSQNKHLKCLYLFRAQVFIHAFAFCIMVSALLP